VYLITNLNFIVNSILVGLIWTIQVVHYPLFLKVGSENFVSYIKSHQNRISILVIPLMSIELLSSIFLYTVNPHIELKGTYLYSLIIVILIWLLTFFVHMPQHKKLLSGFDRCTIKKLVNTNWIRTILWTIKVPIMFKALIFYTFQ
jgi:hypothetical protein